MEGRAYPIDGIRLNRPALGKIEKDKLFALLKYDINAGRRRGQFQIAEALAAGCHIAGGPVAHDVDRGDGEVLVYLFGLAHDRGS